MKTEHEWLTQLHADVESRWGDIDSIETVCDGDDSGHWEVHIRRDKHLFPHHPLQRTTYSGNTLATALAAMVVGEREFSARVQRLMQEAQP